MVDLKALLREGVEELEFHGAGNSTTAMKMRAALLDANPAEGQEAGAEIPGTVLPNYVETAPKNICLGLFMEDPEEPFPDTHEDICWSEGKDGHGDLNVWYMRADIHPASLPDLASIQAAAEKLLDDPFDESQWWFVELDSVATNIHQRRAMAVIKNLLSRYRNLRDLFGVW